jgi:hypothetical protein
VAVSVGRGVGVKVGVSGVIKAMTRGVGETVAVKVGCGVGVAGGGISETTRKMRTKSKVKLR